MPEPTLAGMVPFGGPTTFDTGNTLLNERPAQIVTSALQLPDVPSRVVLTIRTETTTLTLLLTKTDALAWSSQIRTEAEGITESGLFIGRG